MIYGAKYWNNLLHYYCQVNNPTEEILRKTGARGFLETCGSTAAVNCLAVHGYKLAIKCPGLYHPQPEEVLNDWFNDPRNYPALQQVRMDIKPEDLPGNRVPQYYPVAIEDVFNVECQFRWFSTHHDLFDLFKKGCSIQLCLKSPSHYVAAVAYDDETSEIIINDPWPGRFPDGKGFNKRISDMENLTNFAVVYPPLERRYDGRKVS